MSAYAPRYTHDASGVHGDVEEVELVCDCGTRQTQPLDANMSIRQALAEAVCLFCGRLGLRRARR